MGLPSKELVSAVLNLPTPCTKLWLLPSGDLLYYWKGNSRLWFLHRARVNLYEFANMCKQYAALNGEYLHTFPTKKGTWLCTFRYDIDGSYQYCFESDTEFDVTFTATQHIVDEKETKWKIVDVAHVEVQDLTLVVCDVHTAKEQDSPPKKSWKLAPRVVGIVEVQDFCMVVCHARTVKEIKWIHKNIY